MNSRQSIILLLSLLTISFFSALAVEPIQFNFQGRLSDMDGNPAPNGQYDLVFRIFDDSVGGNLLWQESYPAHPISGGLLNVQLGRVNPCTLGVLSPDLLYLEQEIGMGPSPNAVRFPLNWAPRSGSAQRISGDIFTSPGSIRFFDPQPEPPGDDPLIELSLLDGLGTLKFFDPQPEPPGINPLVELRSMPANGVIRLFDPQPEPPGYNNSPLIEMNALSGLGTLRFFDPQPEPPGQTCIELSSDGAARFFTGGTEYMGVEPSPFLGGNLKMYGDAGTTINLSSLGRIGIGTNSTSNIITVMQYSSTDPIADAWTIYSSRRWKTNINTITNPIEKVQALRGVTFDWIEGGRHDIGLIAEEVGQVMPEVVAYEENGVDAKSVDYARLTALLIEAVKEQQKTIEAMQVEINDIKVQMTGKQTSTNIGNSR